MTTTFIDAQSSSAHRLAPVGHASIPETITSKLFCHLPTIRLLFDSPSKSLHRLYGYLHDCTCVDIVILRLPGSIDCRATPDKRGSTLPCSLQGSLYYDGHVTSHMIYEIIQTSTGDGLLSHPRSDTATLVWVAASHRKQRLLVLAAIPYTNPEGSTIGFLRRARYV